MKFYNGKLPSLIKIIVVLNDIIASILGRSKSTIAMKRHIKNGYEGVFSNHVYKYNSYGESHYSLIADRLIKDISISDKVILDLGCGTGILSSMLIAGGGRYFVGIFQDTCLDSVEIKYLPIKVSQH
jgi:2-polyprenyl-3-methyl-5-hydroxy-6-metoxy-1,4-benzoquinol methylase